MVRFGAFLSRHALATQLAIVLAALLLASTVPPRQGRMILVPMLPGAARHLAADAIAGGAQLLGAGPVSQSLVVTGRRDAIAAALRGRGVLLLAAPPAACGDAWFRAV